MLNALSNVLPLLLIIALGYGLKSLNLLSEKDGSSLLKVIFYTGTPSLIFLSILKVELDASAIKLALVTPIIASLSVFIFIALRKGPLHKVPRKTFGALLCGVSIMNTGFLIPFVENFYGSAGLARLAILDGFNGVIVFSLVYAMAAHYGTDVAKNKDIAKKLLLSPPIWALILAVIVKNTDVAPPKVIIDTLTTMAKITSPAILLALGLKFSPKFAYAKLIPVTFIGRFVLGGFIGFALVKLLGLEGISADIAILVSIAPSGFNTITFSELENLDSKFAASQVSAALIAALVIIPIALHYLG